MNEIELGLDQRFERFWKKQGAVTVSQLSKRSDGDGDGDGDGHGGDGGDGGGGGGGGGGGRNIATIICPTKCVARTTAKVGAMLPSFRAVRRKQLATSHFL